MSSTTLDPTRPAAARTLPRTAGPGPAMPPAPARDPFPRVLNSEFIKFRTLLSTLILLACTVLVVVGFGALSAWGTGHSPRAAQDPEAAAAFAAQGGNLAIGVPTSGIAFAQLILGSLGVLLMSSEFTTGMARSTFAAVPRRTPAFMAKLAGGDGDGLRSYRGLRVHRGPRSVPILDNYDLEAGPRQLAVGEDAAGQQRLRGSRGRHRHGTRPLLRNSAGGIMSLVGLFFVAPIAFQLIPGDFFVQARKYLPGNTVEPLTAVSTCRTPWKSGRPRSSWAPGWLSRWSSPRSC